MAFTFAGKNVAFVLKLELGLKIKSGHFFYFKPSQFSREKKSDHETVIIRFRKFPSQTKRFILV